MDNPYLKEGEINKNLTGYSFAFITGCLNSYRRSEMLSLRVFDQYNNCYGDRQNISRYLILLNLNIKKSKCCKELKL